MSAICQKIIVTVLIAKSVFDLFLRDPVTLRRALNADCIGGNDSDYRTALFLKSGFEKKRRVNYDVLGIRSINAVINFPDNIFMCY